MAGPQTVGQVGQRRRTLVEVIVVHCLQEHLVGRGEEMALDGGHLLGHEVEEGVELLLPRRDARLFLGLVVFVEALEALLVYDDLYGIRVVHSLEAHFEVWIRAIVRL